MADRYLTNPILAKWVQSERELKAIYEITKVPPEFLFAVWLRESLSFTSPGPGGAFQFDPPRPITYVAAVLKHWGLHLAPRALEDCWFTAALVAADFLQQKVDSKIGGYATSWEILSDAAWGYNGRAYGAATRSPYVSNDPKRGVQLRIVGSIINANGLRQNVNFLDQRPGVMPFYREMCIRNRKTDLVPWKV